jgi:hypothetical protein
MRTRTILLTFITGVLCLFASGLRAEDREFRYELWACTGLQSNLFDKEGHNVTIEFAKESDPEALFVLNKLCELDGIHGTKAGEKYEGVISDQAIFLRGELKPEVKKTKAIPHGAASEKYQEFVLKELTVQFPLSRNREGKKFDTAYMETHFSFDTLFEDGLTFEGKPVDFAKHTKKSERNAKQ